MKKQFLLLCQVLFYCALVVPAFSFDHNHSSWTKILKTYQIDSGLVNYKKLKKDIAEKKDHLLSNYVSELQKVSFGEFDKWTKDEKMAFLINAYNALTVKLIVDHYPVSSIKKIGGFLGKPWSVEFFNLFDGKIKSLDPIEHDWLRPVYKDVRIHAAVNCASISCPALRNEAFVASRLDKQLTEQMKLWLSDPTRNQIDLASMTLTLSKIFDWYKDDFVNWSGGVVAVFNKYGPSPISEEASKQVKIKFLNYNWNLNEVQ